jgi:hypothetical protein
MRLKFFWRANLICCALFFPKTARITLTGPETVLHLQASEYSFRVAILTLATCLRGLYPEGKSRDSLGGSLSRGFIGKPDLASEADEGDWVVFFLPTAMRRALGF